MGQSANLEISHQITHANFERLGDAHQRRNAHGLLAALDLAEIHGMQVNFLGQFFLSHAGGRAIFADRIPDQFLMWQAFGHALTHNQEAAKLDTLYNLLFYFIYLLASLPGKA